jgi:hypothetical protein
LWCDGEDGRKDRDLRDMREVVMHCRACAAGIVGA